MCQQNGQKTVIVVGAGPVGLVAAILLAQRGYLVQVYDKRQDPRLENGLAASRTIFWGIGPRGQSAMTAAKVQLPQKEGQQLGGMTLGGSMDLLWYGRHPRMGPHRPNALMAERTGVVLHLIKEAQRLHPDRIQLHFSHTLWDVYWDKQSAAFLDPSDNQFTVPYDLLIGADGVHSKTRRLYQQYDLDMLAPLQPALKDWIGFSGIPAEGWATDAVGAQQPLRDDKGLHLKVCIGKSHGWTCFFSANSQGSITGFLSAFRPAMAPVKTQADFLQILGSQIPHLPACLHEPIAAAVAGERKAPLGIMGSVTSMVGPSMVLLGDAAHSVTPNLGQGVNCGMQDALIFAQALDGAGQDISAALQAFQHQRHPEVLALHQLDKMSPAWLGQRGFLHPLYLAGRFHTLVQSWGVWLRGQTPLQMPGPAALAGLGSYCKANAAWERDRNCFFCLVTAACAIMVGMGVHMLRAV